MEKIGFVGVGRMGANMARRLKDQGFTIAAVYDVNAEAAKALAQELGCEAATELKRVTQLSDVIITVVTDDKAMKSIYLGGLLQRSRGKLFINCATISPAMHVWVEQKAEKTGAQSLEACMASSITQAREGSLYLMCGGSEAAFNRAKPILEKLSASMRYIGAAGKAAQVKALVNMVMNINTAGLAEGLGLGAALGLDLALLREVFSQTGANSRVLQTDGEDMQNREHSCFFSAAHAAKDSGIALRLAKDQHLNLPLAIATKKQFDKMVAVGLGELDKSGVAELTFRAGIRRSQEEIYTMKGTPILRWEKGRPPRRATDELAREEPLEIRVDDRPVAVTMRTPGHDDELAAGFLVSEGLIHRREQVVNIASHPRNKDQNVIGVFLADGVEIDFQRLTRHTFVSSSCGLCGKASIESIQQHFPPIKSRVTTEAEILLTLPEKLRREQTAFARTGGLHAAGIFDLAGNLIVLREDVGRHNAVDKVLGRGFLDGLLPFDRHILVVSGRASFEIMQKALAGRVPIVVAVSAPSSLAVEFAKASRQTLAGFVRGERMNVYAGAKRIIFP